MSKVVYNKRWVKKDVIRWTKLSRVMTRTNTFLKLAVVDVIDVSVPLDTSIYYS